MSMFQLWRKIRAAGKIKTRLTRAYGLRRRVWSDSGSSPPYASCYNIPKHWLEGEVSGHVVTFWGSFKSYGFTGEIMVGMFDAWWNHSLEWREGTIQRHPIRGSWEANLASVLRLEEIMAAHPELERLGVSFKGLNLAVKQASAALLVELVEASAVVVDDLLQHREPPLLQAVAAGDLNRAASLLTAGADPDEYGPDLHSISHERCRQLPKTPLLVAVLADNREIVRLLLSHGADITTNPSLILWVALEHGKNQALSALLDGGLEPSAWPLPFDQGYPLQRAAARGDPTAVQILLEAGADPRIKEGFRTARAMAAGPHAGEIERLIDRALIDLDQVRGQLSLATKGSDGGLSLSEDENQSP
jgi:hypothetical protein